jgi:uncharacterized protein
MGAVIGAGRWVLHLPGCASLKGKRKIVRSLRDRVRSRFEVSAAETAYQDEHQRAELCAVLVTSDPKVADSVLTRIDALVSGDPRVYVIERETGLL